MHFKSSSNIITFTHQKLKSAKRKVNNNTISTN